MNEEKINLLEWQKENLDNKEKEEIYGTPENPKDEFEGIDKDKSDNDKEIVSKESDAEKIERELLGKDNEEKRDRLANKESIEKRKSQMEKEMGLNRERDRKNKEIIRSRRIEEKGDEELEINWEELENDMRNKLSEKLKKEHGEADDQDLYAKKLKEDLEKFEIGNIDKEDKEFLRSFGFDEKDKKNKTRILESYKKVTSKILSELENTENTKETDDKEKEKSEIEKWNKLEDYVKNDLEKKLIENKEDTKELIELYKKGGKEKAIKFIDAEFEVQELFKGILGLYNIKNNDENRKKAKDIIARPYYELLDKIESEQEIEPQASEEAKNNIGMERTINPEPKPKTPEDVEPEIKVEQEKEPRTIGEIIELLGDMENYKMFKRIYDEKYRAMAEMRKEQDEKEKNGEEISKEEKEGYNRISEEVQRAKIDVDGAEIKALYSITPKSEDMENWIIKRKLELTTLLLKNYEILEKIKGVENKEVKKLSSEKRKGLRRYSDAAIDKGAKMFPKFLNREKEVDSNQQATEPKKKSKFGWLKEKIGISGEKEEEIIEPEITESEIIEKMKEKIDGTTSLKDLAETAGLINETYNELFNDAFKKELKDEDCTTLRRRYTEDIVIIENITKDKNRKDVLTKFYEKLDGLLKEKEGEVNTENAVDVTEEEIYEKISETTRLKDLEEIAILINKGKYAIKFHDYSKQELRTEDCEAIKLFYNEDIKFIRGLKAGPKKDVLIKFYGKLDELLKEKEGEESDGQENLDINNEDVSEEAGDNNVELKKEKGEITGEMKEKAIKEVLNNLEYEEIEDLKSVLSNGIKSGFPDSEISDLLPYKSNIYKILLEGNREILEGVTANQLMGIIEEYSEEESDGGENSVKGTIKKESKDGKEKIIDLFGDLTDNRIIDKVTTEKGSVYTYLEDGRTQRYKKATDETNEPQDTLVYIPNFEWLQANASKEELEKFVGKNVIKGSKLIFEQKLLHYVHGKGKMPVITSRQGETFETNEQIAEYKNQIYLSLTDNGKTKFAIPVSRKPRIGFNTFDTRIFKKDGVDMRERHIGNKVIDIQTKEDEEETKIESGEEEAEITEEMKGKIREALERTKKISITNFRGVGYLIHKYSNSEKLFGKDFIEENYNDHIKHNMDLDYDKIKDIKTKDFVAVVRGLYNEVKGDKNGSNEKSGDDVERTGEVEKNSEKKEGGEYAEFEEAVVKTLHLGGGRSGRECRIIEDAIKEDRGKFPIFLKVMEDEIKKATGEEELLSIDNHGWDICQGRITKDNKAAIDLIPRDPLFKDIRKATAEKLGELLETKGVLSDKILNEVHSSFGINKNTSIENTIKELKNR